MDKEKYLDDISEIKNLMTESSRFVYLTGLSGLFSGLYALIGAAYFYWYTYENGHTISELNTSSFQIIVIILVVILLLSTITTFILTSRKAKKSQKKALDAISKKLVFNFYSFLMIGGVFITILFFQEKYNHIVSLMLVFYGFAILNGSKYTFKGVSPLGYIQILLGLSCLSIPGYDFWFWTFGFGVVHIIYGSVMHFKYGK